MTDEFDNWSTGDDVPFYDDSEALSSPGSTSEGYAGLDKAGHQHGSAGDHILDKDEALDYLMYRHLTAESEKDRKKQPNPGTGCLGSLAVLLIILGLLLQWK